MTDNMSVAFADNVILLTKFQDKMFRYPEPSTTDIKLCPSRIHE